MGKSFTVNDSHLLFLEFHGQDMSCQSTKRSTWLYDISWFGIAKGEWMFEFKGRLNDSHLTVDFEFGQ